MNTNERTGINLLLDHPFQILKTGFERIPALSGEVETAMRAVIQKVNPSDQGNRFVTGSAYEWIVAAAGWVVGVESVPGGHSEKGFDLLSYRDRLRGLWSIKSSASHSLGEIRLTNTMNNSNGSFTQPTIFIAPKFPGLVYFDPTASPDIADKITQKKDALTISAKTILEYSRANPGCVIPLSAPVNPRTGRDDPYLDFVAGILTAGNYPNLGPIMTKLRANSGTVKFLRSTMESGIIDHNLFQELINKLD